VTLFHLPKLYTPSKKGVIMESFEGITAFALRDWRKQRTP